MEKAGDIITKTYTVPKEPIDWAMTKLKSAEKPYRKIQRKNIYKYIYNK